MKTCFKCHRQMPISEFYAHPRMGDGHLGKCKDCTKLDVKTRISKVKTIPEWRDKERQRCREKADRYRGTTNAHTKRMWAVQNNHKVSAQRKARAALLSGRLCDPGVCADCGVTHTTRQMHHEDYSKPLHVVFLCTKCHGVRHRKPASALVGWVSMGHQKAA